MDGHKPTEPGNGDQGTPTTTAGIQELRHLIPETSYAAEKLGGKPRKLEVLGGKADREG